MAGRDVNLGETGSTVTSTDPTTQPRRASQHTTGSANTSGAVATTSGSYNGNLYPCTYARITIAFPATGGTSTQFASTNTVIIYGNSWPANSSGTSWSSTDLYETSSFSVSKTAITTKTFDINFATYSGDGTNYNFTYGAGRNNQDAGRMALTYGQVTSSPNAIYLDDNTTSVWSFDRAGKLRCSVSVLDVPSAPTSLGVVDKTPGAFRVRWRVPAETGGSPTVAVAIDGYRVMIYNWGANSYTVLFAGTPSTYTVGGTPYYYYDVSGLSTTYYNSSSGTYDINTYDVYVAAYNSVTTSHNSGFSYSDPRAHTGTNAVYTAVTWQEPSGYIWLTRKNSDYLQPDTVNYTPAIEVSAPAGSGNASWTVTGNNSFSVSGTVAAGSTSDISTSVGDIPTYADSGLLKFTLTVTNSIGSATDFAPWPEPDAPPLAANLIDFSGYPGSTDGSIDLYLQFSGPSGSGGNNGRTYARIYQGSYTGDTSTRVWTYGVLEGTTSAYETRTITDLTPGQTYYFRVYLFNNAGYYSNDITVIAAAGPTVTVVASNYGYFIKTEYTVTAPASMGDTYWYLTRSDGEDVTSGIVSAGSNISETFIDEGVQPGSSYSYTITAVNNSSTIPVVTSSTITVPSLNTGGFTGDIGGYTLTPNTGAWPTNTDWMSDATFNSGYTSGKWDADAGDFTTQKPIYIYSAKIYFRAASGTVEAQMGLTSNPSNSSNVNRWYQRTRSSSTPIVVDPDNLTSKTLANGSISKPLTFNPRNQADQRLIGYAGDTFWVGFRQISGSSVTFYRAVDDGGTAVTSSNAIYRNGANVSSEFPSPTAASIYVDFVWRTVPNAPTNVTASATSADVTDPSSEARITWTTPSNMGGYVITGYRILYRPVDGDWATTGKFGNLNSNAYILTGLESGTDYEIVIAAVNAVSDLFNSNNSSMSGYPYTNITDHTGTNSAMVTVTTEVATVPDGPLVSTNYATVSSITIANSGKYMLVTTVGNNIYPAAGNIVSLSDLGAAEIPNADGLYFIKSVISSDYFRVLAPLDANDEPYADGGPYRTDLDPEKTSRVNKWMKATVKKRNSSSGWDLAPVLKVREPGEWVTKLPVAAEPTLPDTIYMGTDGMDDAFFEGSFTGLSETTYYVKIVYGAMDSFTLDKFRWSTDNFATDNGSDITINAEELYTLSNGVKVSFATDVDHTYGDIWYSTWTPPAA